LQKYFILSDVTKKNKIVFIPDFSVEIKFVGIKAAEFPGYFQTNRQTIAAFLAELTFSECSCCLV
jgi:hypothetical protein